MANKTQVTTAGEQQAAVVINNHFIDGLTKQLEEKCKYAYGSISGTQGNERQK